MRLYGVREAGSEELVWENLHQHALKALDTGSALFTQGEHESLIVSFALLVGRIVVAKQYDTSPPRLSLEISGTAQGTDLQEPSDYVGFYADGDDCIRLRIDER
ncbi:hypothetical protein COU91_01460 [Candidatus Saccharibacteria bacterium CG10_big_fil_rev_8_21_14_0_10_47_8]|nr:MAG: hypothetical protein COU91_01460 [Candidatus Saccharibacteria bacterium CG10_big_fil_rev_8_21_14_0_10_47_8]